MNTLARSWTLLKCFSRLVTCRAWILLCFFFDLIQVRFKSAWSCSADLRHAITDRIKLERPEKIYWSHKTELFSVSIYWLLFAERLKSGSGRRVQTEEVVNPPCFFLNQIKCVGVGWLSQCYKFSDLVGGVLHSIQALGWGGVRRGRRGVEEPQR